MLNLPSPNLNFSQRQALGLTAFASIIATTSVILSYQALRREHRTERLKRQVGEDVERWEHSRAGSGFGTPEERAERLAEDGEWKVRDWKKGEFDEGLVREQVSSPRYEVLGTHRVESRSDSGEVMRTD
jgi:hypothetical protein